jgi:serine-type D-Ala-D-Ala carboxypeptidase (penicillin-binding protein 5/6)
MMAKHYQHTFFKVICVLVYGLVCTAAQAVPQLNSSKWLIQQWEPNGIGVTNLASQDAATVANPASITKLLTAYTVLHALNASNLQSSHSISLDTVIPIGLAVVMQERSTVGYKMGDVVTVKDALQGMLAVSGNDAAWALAEFFGQGDVTRFAAQMNSHSNRLGLLQSHWKNPHGLTQEQHVSSAGDLLKIAHALWYEFPVVRPWLSLKTYTWNGVTQRNRNNLLHDEGVDGLKTGYTRLAGYNLATTSHVTMVAGMDSYEWRLSIVTLGATRPDLRETDHRSLMAWARSEFTPWKLFSKNEQLGELKISNVLQPIPVHTVESIWQVLSNTVSTDQLQYELVPLPNLSAPIVAGQVVATLNIYLNDVTSNDGKSKLLLSAPAISLDAVSPTSLMTRLIDWIKTAV